MMQVKYVFYIITILFLLQCKPDENIPLPEFSTGVINMCGKVNNFKKNKNSETIKVAVNDLATNEQHIYKTKIVAGNFEINFPLEHPQEFFFYYGNELLQMFAIPGDSLKMELDFDRFFDEERNNSNIAFTKDGTGVNAILSKYLAAYQQTFLNTNKPPEKKKITVKSYEKSRFEMLKKQQDFLKKFIRNNKVKNVWFKKWAENTLRYNAGKDVLSKAVVTKRDTSDFDVIKLLQKVPLNDDFAIATAAYDYFLQYYQMYITADPDDGHNHGHKLSKAEKLSTHVDKIVENTAGLAREIAMSKYYFHHIGMGQTPFPSSLMETFDSLVTNPLYKSKIREKYDVLYKSGEIYLDSQIVINKVPNDVENLLAYLLDRHKGKVVYMDIWATWCQPCLREMNIYPKLHQEFNEDIQYIFLATDSSPALWYKKIKQLQLKGEHYLLTKEQYLFLQQKLYIDGIPHYVLVNKKGKIVDDMAPRPSVFEGKAINPELVETIKTLL